MIASTDGVAVALHDFGGTGAPLIVAHATGFCAGAYLPMVRALTDAFHVWGIDFRGHGDSTAPENGRFAWSGMTDDLLAAVDGIGAPSGTLHAFGHSMGGAVCLLAEVRRPGLFASAFLYEPIVIPPGIVRTGESPLVAAARRRRADFGSREEALMRYASRRPLDVLRADALAAYVEHGFRVVDEGGAIRLKCDPESEARTFESAEITLDLVAAAAVPTVVAVGDREGTVGPAGYAPHVAATLPNATLVRYGHLGHFGPFQDPEGVAADITRAAGRPAGR